VNPDRKKEALMPRNYKCSRCLDDGIVGIPKGFIAVFFFLAAVAGCACIGLIDGFDTGECFFLFLVIGVARRLDLFLRYGRAGLPHPGANPWDAGNITGES
jgi:hypothetical protein